MADQTHDTSFPATCQQKIKRSLMIGKLNLNTKFGKRGLATDHSQRTTITYSLPAQTYPPTRCRVKLSAFQPMLPALPYHGQTLL